MPTRHDIEDQIQLEDTDESNSSAVLDFEKKLTDDEINNILKKRALALAEELEEEINSDDFLNIVEFMLGEEKYAISAEYTKQVSTLKDYTVLPCVPSYVIGITKLHEQIISVIDIRQFFGMQHTVTNLDKLIILQSNEMSFGIIADSVIGMKTIQITSIQHSISTLDDARKKYFYGLSDEQTIILDGFKILSDKEILIN